MEREKVVNQQPVQKEKRRKVKRVATHYQIASALRGMEQVSAGSATDSLYR